MALSRHVILGLGAMAIATTAVFAGSHGASPEQKAVKARQAHMQLYSYNLGILGAMAKGEMPYSADAAAGAAGDLAAMSMLSQASYWLPGTNSTDIEGSNALAAAWEMYPDIATKGQALATAAMAMKEAAGSVEGIQGAIGAVGGACGACHKAYRKPAG